MRDNRPETTQNLLKKKSIQHLHQHALELSRLNQLVSTLLPEATAKHCRVANYRNGILILECGSSAWVTRLNYDRLHILASLRRQLLPSLMTIEIKVNPKLSVPDSVIKDKKTQNKDVVLLSSFAAESLLAIAENAPERIKKKLQQIAALSTKNHE